MVRAVVLNVAFRFFFLEDGTLTLTVSAKGASEHTRRTTEDDEIVHSLIACSSGVVTALIQPLSAYTV